MRSVLIATLLLAPMASVLTARASEPAKNTIPSLSAVQVSTGVRAATLVRDPKEINVPLNDLTADFPKRAQVDFTLNVDKDGRAQNIQLVSSNDPYLNGPAYSDVLRMQWRPARLDHHSITDPVDLRMIITLPTSSY
jgi:hypothetical protein